MSGLSDGLLQLIQQTESTKKLKVYHPDLFFDNKKIVDVFQHNHLGLTLSSNLSWMTWKAHILKVYEKACKRLNLLKGLKYIVHRETLNRLYKSLIRPLMGYGDVLWDGCTDGEGDLLEFVQYEAAKIVTGAMKGTSRRSLLRETGWEDLKTRRSIHKLKFYFKTVNNLTPNYLRELLLSQVSERTPNSFRSCSDYTLFPVRTERFKNSFFPSATKAWNNIDITITVRSLESVISFQNALFTIFDASTLRNVI